MPSKAKIYLNDRSPYYQAWFEVWDAKTQKWKPVMKSTKCTDGGEDGRSGKALEIAQHFERVALAAGGMNGKTRLSRDFVVDAVNSIMTTAGHRPVEDQKKWSDYSQNWLTVQKKRIAKKQLGEKTWVTYKGQVNHFTKWLEATGESDISIAAIDGDMVTAWYEDTLKTGLSVSTVNNTATTLSVILEKARDEGFTARNPFNLLTRDSATGNKRDDFTEEQMHTILSWLKSPTSPTDKETLPTMLRSCCTRLFGGDLALLKSEWLTVAYLGFCTSQRLGDCRGAVRTAFEFTDPWLIWTLTPGKTERTTGTTLRIPIVLPEAAAHFAQILRSSPTALFLAPTLAALESDGWQDSPSAQFKAILEVCGIEGRKVAAKGKGRGFSSLSFHSTRHTCNSMLANAGVPFELRKLITGHAEETTNIIYTHLKDATKAKALQKAFSQKTPSKKKKVS